MEVSLITHQSQRFPLLIHPSTIGEIMPDYVSEVEYWERYYEDPTHNYEWNNGYLEEKGMSDKMTLQNYQWFFELLINYLRVTGMGDIISLETAFRLPLSYQDITIRKPDLGVVLKNNPVSWNDRDRSFQGICDLCVEALSDSTPKVLKLDTVTKFNEYAQIGVREYYILYAHGDPQEFYRLSKSGYIPIPRATPDIICSTVLPGFQFRISDLQRQPSPEEMSEDSVYRAFMLPMLQAERLARKFAEQRLEITERRLESTEQRLESTEQLLESTEQRLEQEEEARKVAERQMQKEYEARLAVEDRLHQLEVELARRH